MKETPRLQELLDQYEEAVARGQSPDVEEMCRNAPELADEFKARVAALEDMDAYLEETAAAPASRSSEDTLPVSSELTRLRFHDNGGLGVVYRAQEVRINREVAVKFIHHNLASDEDSRTRFELEAEVTGRLEHPGVVPLYGIGRATDDRMFYYMRFIDGSKMDDAIRDFHKYRPVHGRFTEQSVEFRRLLTSFVSVCKTIAYAHNRGIVHRDIKPANIMLGKYGETLVVDWGLATPVTRDQRFTVSGEVTLRPKSGNSGISTGSGAGTAAYMSPEQASELAPTPASDIYSLGATLYKILTGTPSVTGEQLTELKRQIISGQIKPPRSVLSSVPAPLEAICMRAMALHPNDRYDTALDLATDVENYLADSDVAAYAEPWTRKAARLARKHRFAAQTAVASLLVIAAIMSIASVWLGTMARSEKKANQVAQHLEQMANVARKDNLRTSALYLAESISHQIDKRWRVLESARSSPELIACLKSLSSEPGDLETRETLQNWLSKCKANRNVFRSDNSIWVIFGRDATMQAREPQSRVIGDNFSYRDYFHGFGSDLTGDEPELQGVSLSELEPHHFLLQSLSDLRSEMHSAHLSDVFLSTASKHLQVTFSVPIWDRPDDQLDKVAIGLFSISLEIQDLPLPSNAMLVQIRPDQLTNQRGLVISHQRLKPHTDKDQPPRVPEVVEIATELKRYRMREHQGIQSVERPPDPLITDFVDPVAERQDGGQFVSIAAVEPVIVHTRPKAIADTGWAVVVKETNSGFARAADGQVSEGL